jgi:hypothetical protein
MTEINWSTIVTRRTRLPSFDVEQDDTNESATKTATRRKAMGFARRSDNRKPPVTV